jgi:hypothetical protein
VFAVFVATRHNSEVEDKDNVEMAGKNKELTIILFIDK